MNDANLDRELEQLARDVLAKHGRPALVSLAIAALELEQLSRPPEAPAPAEAA